MFEDLLNHEFREKMVTMYVQVQLINNTYHCGYIGNAKEFQQDGIPEKMVLLNGLLQDVVNTADIVDISYPRREDTAQIPIVDTVKWRK